MSISIRVDHHNPLARFNLAKAVIGWADEIGPVARTELKARAPVYQANSHDPHPRPPGRMKRSIRYSRTGNGANIRVEFKAHTPYAKFVVEGTRAHPIEARAARMLHFYTDEWPFGHFRRRVWHPGTRPNDFPTQALRAVRRRAVLSLRDRVQRALEES